MSGEIPKKIFESQGNSDAASTPSVFKLLSDTSNSDLDKAFENLQFLSQRYGELFNNFQEAFGSTAQKPDSLNEIDRLIGIINIYPRYDDDNRTLKDLEKYSRKLETQLIKAEEDYSKLIKVALKEELENVSVDSGGVNSNNVSGTGRGVSGGDTSGPKSPEPAPESGKLNDLEKTGLLTEANNFDHLYILMDKTGPIEGSTKDFSIDIVKEIVANIYKLPVGERQKAQRLALKDVTKQNGLREVMARCFEAKDEELSLEHFFENSPFNNKSGSTKRPDTVPGPKSPDTPLASPNEPKVPDPLPDSPAGAGEPSAKVENTESDPKIKDLYNRYKNADESVFKENPGDPNSAFQKFSDIHNDIRDVLKYAGVEEKVRDQFLDEKVTGYYHGEITLALRIKKEGRSKAQFANDLPALKAAAQEKAWQIYQKLAKNVAELINEVEAKKTGADSKVPDPDKETGKEKLEQDIKSCTTWDELYTLLDKLGEITGSRDVSFSSDQLKTQIEIIRDEVTKLIKTHPDGDINTLVEVVYTVQGNSITSTGGLREHVKRLVKQEHGLNKIEKEEPTTDGGDSKEGGLDSYREARKNLFDAKNVLLSKEEEYKKAFEVRGLISKIKGGVGVEDAKLQALKLESDSLRTAYAKALDAALQVKSDRKRTKSVLDGDGKVIGAMETDDESIFKKPKFKYATLADDKTKEHFVKKLILTPRIKNQEWIESLESPTKKTVIKGVVGFLKKHKWALRAGVIVGAGLLAGTTGGIGLGLSAAAYKAGRLGWSLKVGTAAAIATNIYGENKWVGKAGQNLNETVKDANTNFTLDNIASLNANIIKADKGVSSARRKQTAATIGAGILAGGGYSALAEGLVWPASEPDLSVNNSDIIKERPPYVSSGVDGAEIRVFNRLGFSGEGVSDLNLERVDSFIKTQVDRAYADSVHFNVDKLENNLPGMLAGKFGGEAWWPEKGIIVDLEVELKNSSAPDVVSVPVEVGDVDVSVSDGNSNDVVFNDTELNTAPEPLNENIYTVQKRDTLSHIVNKHFAEELKNAPPGQYNQVLYKVLDNIEKSAELRESLGMKSNDIDLIYPDEKLDLTAVGEELKKVLAERQAIVDGPDLEVVPNIELPATESPDILSASNDDAKFKVPEVTAVNGLYFNQPEWKNYISNHFGTEAAFNQVLTAEVAAVDKLQADWFSNFLGGEDFVSPYEVLSKMTIEELVELKEGPDFGERVFSDDNNLKYENYQDWQNLIEDLLEKYEYSEGTTLADLFNRYVAETKSPLLNKLAK